MERFESVKIGSTLSDLQKLLFGVPQGSVLGLPLFSLYTSALSTNRCLQDVEQMPSRC